MSDGKIQFSLGALSFSGEGEPNWLAEQLDKILKAAPELGTTQETVNDGASAAGAEQTSEFRESLASYIKAKGGESNQVQRFLATASWVKKRGTHKLTTSAVSRALSQNQQKRLTNPADSLNKNVSKGYCEKQGDGFFITPDGLKALGDE